MAWIGGRAGRWAARAGAATVAAVVVTAAFALTDRDDGLAPAAAGGSETVVDPGPSATAGPTWSDGYATYPGSSRDAPFVSFIGDSWTYGKGATGLVGYAPLTGRLLGWKHRVLGVGGSGYVEGGRGDIPFEERIEAAVAGNPDVVVIQGSINDRTTVTPLAELRPAVADTLEELVAAAGADTAVVVLGASHVPGVPAEEVDPINDTLRAEAGRLGLTFVDVVAENWSDPDDPAIWADSAHVDDAGAEQVAERLAPVLRAVLGG
jgi:acyl-CoA thioesterase-1